MKFKKVAAVCASAVAACGLAVALVGCGGGAAKQVAVPSDATNEARALLLLQDQGIIKLADGVGLNATKNDITENPYNIEIVEAEAASLPRMLADVDMAVINGNYAISADINPATALASEDSASEAAVEYGNVVAVRSGEEKSPKTEALLAALESDTVKDFIDATYNGAVVATFESGEAVARFLRQKAMTPPSRWVLLLLLMQRSSTRLKIFWPRRVGRSKSPSSPTMCSLMLPCPRAILMPTTSSTSRISTITTPRTVPTLSA